MNFFFATIFGFFLAVQAVQAHWIHVMNPNITHPNSDSDNVWHIGKSAVVMWIPPDNITNWNVSCTLVLTFSDGTTNPLAGNIDINSGLQRVNVSADLKPGQYHVTLNGDSSYSVSSPNFTIEECPVSDSDSDSENCVKKHL